MAGDEESTDQSSKSETVDSIKQEPQLEPTEHSAERNVQVEVVLRILKECIDKLRISLLLPRFVQNHLTVRQYLEGTKYQPCSEALDAFLKKNKDNKAPPLANFDLIKLIDKFHENFGMLELVPNWVEGLREDDKALLDAFQILYTIAEQRLPTPAKIQLANERKLHKIYQENEKIKKHITELEEKVQSQKNSKLMRIAAERSIIQRYEEELALKKADHNLRIKKEIVLTTRRIKAIQASSVVKQRELEEQLEKTKAGYEKLLKDNIHQEKEVRDEKNKLLLQLQALIRKFDTNIGEKMQEIMDLQELYAEQKKDFDKFMVEEFQREEAYYLSWVKKKEIEQQKAFEHRLFLFMMRRAARTIQYYWREYRKRHPPKKKK